MIKKNEKGITMITLVITIIVLAIVTMTIATNSYDSTQLSKLTKLDNDIKALNDRIATYYLEHESDPNPLLRLPLLGNAYTKDTIKKYIPDVSGNDGDEYYTIDLSLLDNLTLNYGKDYLSFGADQYVINLESHIIYYWKGVTYKGENQNGKIKIERKCCKP